jgi:hypothetical protein
MVHSAAAIAYGIIIAALPRGEVGLEEQITLYVTDHSDVTVYRH